MSGRKLVRCLIRIQQASILNKPVDWSDVQILADSDSKFLSKNFIPIEKLILSGIVSGNQSLVESSIRLWFSIQRPELKCGTDEIKIMLSWIPTDEVFPWRLSFEFCRSNEISSVSLKTLNRYSLFSLFLLCLLLSKSNYHF